MPSLGQAQGQEQAPDEACAPIRCELLLNVYSERYGFGQIEVTHLDLYKATLLPTTITIRGIIVQNKSCLDILLQALLQ